MDEVTVQAPERRALARQQCDPVSPSARQVVLELGGRRQERVRLAVAPAPQAQRANGVGSGASAPSSSSPGPAAAPAPRAVPAKQEKSQPKQKVDKGALIEAPHPVYPVEAREQKIQGTVRVDVVIDENGKVVSAKAKSGPEQLHSASQDAAYKARFKPAIINGKPVEIAAAISYNFVIR